MTANEKESGHWLFQCNPKILNLKEALRADVLAALPVTAHLSKISPGDLVVLWMSGPEAGCYGLARVRSEIQELSIPEKMLPFFRQNPRAEKMVYLDTEYNLWNQPITKDMLPEHPAFQSFPAGLPGATFSIHAEAYPQLVKLVEKLSLLEEPLVDYTPPSEADYPLNLILYGPPGTGKTYQTVNYALSIIEKKPLEELALENRKMLLDRYRQYEKKGQIALVTFHASFAYEDFVEGIKPKVIDQQLSYETVDGLFKKMCMEAERAKSNTSEAKDSPRFVLIIDEINRGNIPNIFGELITLLEADKRADQVEARSVLLPYSKRVFSIPGNLYIVATMNTADRSLVHMDAALRRRFAFRAVRPEPGILKRSIAARTQIRGIQLDQLLYAINQRLSLLLDEEHTIGHGYFMQIHHLEQLKDLFYDYLIPQLQEYFINDMEKIGLILGQGFVRQKSRPAQEKQFADFSFPFVEELLEKKVYYIRPRNEIDESDFIKIYQTT